MKWLVLCVALAGCDVVFGLDRPPPPSGPWSSIAAADTASCAIKLDGTLWCWGTGETVVEAPTQISGAQWTSVSAKAGHVCAIQEDASLWCFGDNRAGQLGVAMPAASTALLQVPGAWRSVSTGVRTTCGIRDSGVLACWGRMLGSSAMTSTPTDMQPDVTSWTTVDVARDHACALRDGELWCWGEPLGGKLGDETIMTPVATPTRIGSDAWRAISAGLTHTCGIRDDGRLACWGDSRRGQLGDGTRVTGFVPALIGVDADWTAIVTAYEHTCGVRADESLWCWGDNTNGKHGSDVATIQLSPVEVVHPRGWSAVAIGNDHLCAIDRNHQLYCAGSRSAGQLGDGPTHSLVPTQIAGTWSSLSLRGFTACAHDATGVPFCWGYGQGNQIGDGAGETRQAPTRIGPRGGRELSVGSRHACELRAPGSHALWCWGGNSFGQLGAFLSGDAELPVEGGFHITDPVFTTIASSEHTCAIADTQRLWCWGFNNDGQLGSAVPFSNWGIPMIVGTSLWTAVAAGSNHTCGVDTTGGLFCWGHINVMTLSTAIAQIALTFAADRVVAGSRTTCVWKIDGQAACWGDNQQGQVGVPGLAMYLGPTVLDNTWHDLAVGDTHTCGVAADRSLWCWGDNAHGQLGDGTHMDRATPMRVGSERTWEAVEAGAYSSCARTMTGELWCWGDNTYGQLGTETSWRSELAEVL